MDVLTSGLRNAGVEAVLAAKGGWGVSAAALAHRLHELGMTSDWTYHSTFRRPSQLGDRSGEPDDEGHVSRERSQALDNAFGLLKEGGVRQTDAARELQVHPETLRSLLFGLVLTPIPDRSESIGGRANLRAVEN